MSTDVVISVVVPVYNTEKYLERCVKSILEQTYKNLEIILINDGSTDKSGEICNSFAELDTRIRVIHKENGGLSSARNAGIEASHGQYIGFVDSDDWIEPEMYRTMINRLMLDGTKLSVCGRFDCFENSDRTKVGLCPPENEILGAERAVGKMLTWDGLDSAAWDKLFDISLFQDIRFPIGRQSEDVAIMYQLFFLADQISMIAQPFYSYFHRENSITTGRGFSDKKFDTVRFSDTILQWVRQNHPGIVEQALFFRVSMIIYAYKLAEEYDLYQNREYHCMIGQLSEELKAYLSVYIRMCKRLCKKYRYSHLLLMQYPAVYFPTRRIVSVCRRKIF